jgi:ribosomal protein L37AE/L43A
MAMRYKLNKIDMKTQLIKTCYCCHLDKNKSEMQEIGVWICNECFEKSKPPVKKQINKPE